MDNSKKEKVNKNPENSKKDVIAIIVVIAMIFTYVFYECYKITNVDVETITAVNSTVYESIDTKALVIRDEKVINTNANGVSVAGAGDGEKVKLGGIVAMTFSSEENAKAYSTLQELHSQLDYYIDIESKSAGVATDIETVDRDILNDVNDYIREINSSDYNNVSDCAKELNDKLTRRQIMIGEDVDFSAVKTELENQINNINTSACQPTAYVKSEESGVFSSYTDGLETAFDYSKVMDLDVETLESYINQAKENKQGNTSFGKLITSYKWYFCAVLDADDVKEINNGDVLNVSLKDSDQIIECTVESGADVQLNDEKTVLILSSSQLDSEISSMRLEDIEIRYNEHTGFKVPSSALHVDDEGNKCVYALVANQVAERKGNIIYSTEDYVIFESGLTEDNSIRYYDQIITKGKDLHDGKIYS